MTISQVLKTSSLPRAEAETLLAFFLNKNRELILTHPETIISPVIHKKFQAAEKKRLNNWPLAYLTGRKEFYGLDFRVSPVVLTPRPETEMLVEEIVKMAAEKKQPLIIDLGTGSGAIIISVANELRRLGPAIFKQNKFLALDIFRPALKMAQTNARQHKLNRKIKFFSGDLLAPIMARLKNRKIIIAANLPYLTPAQIKSSPTIQREPRLALDGGQDGLKYYRRLFAQLKNIPFSGATVFCEIDPRQDKKIANLAKKYWPASEIEIKKDLAGKNRLVIIKLKNC